MKLIALWRGFKALIELSSHSGGADSPKNTQPCAPIMICDEFGSRSKIAKVARVQSQLNHVVNEGRLPASVARGQLLH